MPLHLQEGGTMGATGVEAAMDSASACADRHIKLVPRNHIMPQVCLWHCLLLHFKFLLC